MLCLFERPSAPALDVSQDALLFGGGSKQDSLHLDKRSEFPCSRASYVFFAPLIVLRNCVNRFCEQVAVLVVQHPGSAANHELGIPGCGPLTV